MVEHGIYFAQSHYYDVIRTLGGEWNDTKERPIVCLIKLKEQDKIYWAIPMGNLNHRTPKAKERIQSYINRDKRDIASCYYHVGRTTTTTIFFISDVIPITDKYIDREYLGYDKQLYIIKNPKLINELQSKLKRILFFENNHRNYFRQHISDIKDFLLSELAED